MYELSSGYLRDNFGMRVNVYYVPNTGTAKCCKYALFLYKNTFFPQKKCFMRAFALTFSDTFVPSDAALRSNSPEATVAKCSKYAKKCTKNKFFCHFICIFAFFVVPLQPISKRNIYRGVEQW